MKGRTRVGKWFTVVLVGLTMGMATWAAIGRANTCTWAGKLGMSSRPTRTTLSWYHRVAV